MRLAGCSTDTLEAQRAFADKLGGLRFPLIADPDASVAKAYGVFKEVWKVAGRATALIGEDGTVLKTWPEAPLHGKGHAEEVFDEAEKLLP
ncbi:MAG: thioredoxin-dependent peroxiredoxin [Bradyrhizobium sp.]|nr:thioredoxin-dependent peroxiredoxin [Bradyrhizobium sp.]